MGGLNRNHNVGVAEPAPDWPVEDLVEPAIKLVAHWLERYGELETRQDRRAMERLFELIQDDDGVDFVMKFIDRVTRPDDVTVAARQLATLVSSAQLPTFLSPVDRALLRAGAVVAPRLPKVVIPLALWRMRSIVGHLVAPADHKSLRKHMETQRAAGYQSNVNLLGEAVLGEREAQARLDGLLAMVEVPEVDYVSVKTSAVASQLNHWDYDASLERVIDRVAHLIDRAAAATPPTFVNFDMEEYHDLGLTVDAFRSVLDEPERSGVDAGIVLQAYLPDVFDVLRDLVQWANERHQKGGGTIKIRLVKGANLAMEKVDAAMHGWEQAPYTNKADTDASYKRCVDWLLREENVTGVQVGIASHNLFDVAWAWLVAQRRNVADRVQFEMLQGMSPAQAAAVNETTESQAPLLLYTPAVSDDDFDVAIGYLFRRLEENAAEDNFMRSLFDLRPGSDEFLAQAQLFRASVERRLQVGTGPARLQNRTAEVVPHSTEFGFVNEADTDPSLAANRSWIASVVSTPFVRCRTELTVERGGVDSIVQTARSAAHSWRDVSPQARRSTLYRVADELSRRRGELLSAMMNEASKTISEADSEVSEAIDFARWYGDRCLELDEQPGATFTPHGVVGVIPPWNFPVAIPAGGVFAGLAAGNSVVLKPSLLTRRCAELVAEICWDAGVGRDVLQFVLTEDNDVGRHLVESVDAVILTGSCETADLFRSWKPDINLMAETSGKNVIIVTPSADIDSAVEQLVVSAFGHAGQKCSAASLVLAVGSVYDDQRFRNQLIDAVESLTVGSSTELGTDIAPLVGGGNERLSRVVSKLDGQQRWLVEPQVHNGVMTPGVLDGVTPESWFYQTECFGPVLGIVYVRDLTEAIAMANGSAFGLTGGIQSLDPAEIKKWMETIEVGNGYVNRSITGAIVRRQPFGGWKRSSVGLGAKAGGSNYLMQLGTWGVSEPGISDDYKQQWETHFSRQHDDAGLFCEANIFRYRPYDVVGLLISEHATGAEVNRVRKAARLCGVRLAELQPGEGVSEQIESLSRLGVERIRLVGAGPSMELRNAAIGQGIHLISGPVTPSGRLELQHYLREQAMSVTLHRFGNLVLNPLLTEAGTTT